MLRGKITANTTIGEPGGSNVGTIIVVAACLVVICIVFVVALIIILFIIVSRKRHSNGQWIALYYVGFFNDIANIQFQRVLY